VISGVGNSVFRSIDAFSSKVLYIFPVLDLISGIGCIILLFVYFIALNIDFGSSFSKNSF